MKKLSFFLLALLLVVSAVFACTADEGDNGDTTTGLESQGTTEGTTATVTDDAATTTEAVTEGGGTEAVNLSAWFDYGSALYHRDKYETKVNDSIAVSMAKNEMEGFQYVLVSDTDLADLRCELSTMTDGKGNTIEGEIFVAYNLYHKKTEHGHRLGFYPEILLEQDDEYVGGTFDLTSDRLRVVYVRFITDANTVPGEYTGRLELKQGDTVLKSGDVTLTVWNVYYEEETACKNAFNYLYQSDSYGTIGPFGPAECPDLAYDEYYAELYADFLLEHRISPSGGLPYADQLADDRAAKYLDNPRFSFMVYYGISNNVNNWYDVASEKGWLDKIAFTLYDEPTTAEQMEVIRSQTNLLTNRFPTTMIMNAFGPNVIVDGKNIVEQFAEYSTFHCINASYFAYYDNDDVAETMLRLKEERGDTILWYVCAGQPYDTINIQGTTPGTEKRILFWQQYLYGLDGFHYFQTTMWQFLGKDNSPWQEGYDNIKFKPVSSNSPATTDGVLVYWHPVTKEPVGGIGLEGVRDGIEDYQLLDMADRLLGREVTLTYVTRLTTALNEYTKDAELYMTVRNELAAAVEAALNS